jgi:hypothetical protein
MNIRREGGKATLSHDVKMTREPPRLFLSK